VPTEWTDKIGSKIKLNKGAFGILLSVLRLRLVYSPFYGWLRPLRPLEAWIYKRFAGSAAVTRAATLKKVRK